MDDLRPQLVDQTDWDSAERLTPRRGARATPNSVGLGSQLSSETYADLVDALAADFVPRLVLAQGNTRQRHLEGAPAPSQSDIVEFSRIIVNASADTAFGFVDDLRQRGVSIETAYLDLFAPTARRLGDGWIADTLNFAEVTLGLLRLHHLVRELSQAFDSEVDRRLHGLNALLLPAPGEQHTFGLLLVAEFLRRAGWAVRGGPLNSPADLTRAVRGEWFAVVGFSVSCDSQLGTVTENINTVRKVSRNRAVGVLVGGRIFVEHPELVRKVGADATAIDGREAVVQARNLVSIKSDSAA
jgi:MerR family transcriptional regulator, light-induced transcriptional regulator